MEIKEDICQENLLAEYAEERGLLPEEMNFRINNKQRPKICTELKSIEEGSFWKRGTFGKKSWLSH